MRTFTTLEAVQPTRRRVITLGTSPKKAAAKTQTAPEQQLSFKNTQSGKNLAGTLTEEREGSKRKQAVILAHGFASYREGFHLPAIAQALAQKGVSSLRIDFAGNGDSEGTFQYGNYAEEAEDLRAAVQFLRAKGFDVVGIVGHSKGANSAMLYASIYDDVPNIVNIAGRFDLKRGITERFGNDIAARLAQEKQIPLEDTRDDGTPITWSLTKWSYQDRISTDMQAACKQVRCAEVLTIHGTKDRVTPVEDAHQWGAHLAHHSLRVIDGADHSFLMPAFSQQMIAAVVEQCAL